MQTEKLKTAQDYLNEAHGIMQSRGKEYDSNGEQQERSMKKVIDIFNILTEYELNESDGWLLMVILKQVRQSSSNYFHKDSAIDSVAYSALLAEALEKEETIIG